MRSILQRVFKPEYVFRPRQILQRLVAPLSNRAAQFQTTIPGGCRIRASTHDDLGRALHRLGVFDLVVTEALWRLADPGEFAIDAGANIGYMTAILGARVNPSGTVLSFEPHPQLFAELAANCDQFRRTCPGTTFALHPVALSDRAGALRLKSFGQNDVNRGTSHIVMEDQAGTISIPAKRLDDVVSSSIQAGVMKIDVEGHELSLLRGSKSLLSARRVRDIVFEEHRAYPTDVTEYLESLGMTVVRLGRNFRGPALLPPDSKQARSFWEATSFIATFQPDRVRNRLTPRGWQCLSS